MASGSISEFLQSFKTDLARPSRFDVTLYPPQLMRNSDPTEYTQRLNMRCENAELPSRTLQTYDLKTYGPTEKFPYQNAYNDVNLTFIVGDDMFERQFFDNWMNYISSTNDFNFKYWNDYVTDINIVQYNVTNEASYGCQLIDAYPIAVNQLDLDWTSDGHHKLTVVFAYTFWQNVTNELSGSSTAKYDNEIINKSTDVGTNQNGKLILPSLSQY